MIEWEAADQKISFVVPAYNCAGYLRGCVESLISQSYANTEIILIDDGSTDETGVICDNYEKEYDKVRVIHQKNSGQSVARNKGVSVAEGQWICFVDGDDIIHPKMAESLLEMAKKEKTRMSACGHFEGMKPPVWTESNSSYQCIEVNEKSLLTEAFDTWCVWARLIDKEIIREHPFTAGKVYEDNAVVLEWLSDASRIVVTDEQLYFYRINLNSTTKREFNIKQLDILWAIEQRIGYCVKRNYRELLGENLKIYLYRARELCGNLRQAANKDLAKSTKKRAVSYSTRQLKNTKNKIGILLRLIKCILIA